jgi:propanediol dehydratase small subunit
MSDEQLTKKIERLAQTKGVNISPDLIKEAVKRVVAVLSEGTVGTQAPAQHGRLDPKKDYPLAQKRPDLVKTSTGLSLADVTLDKVVGGKVNFEDMKIRPETLEYQAQIAEGCGRPQLANNIRRAAELTRLSDARVLEVYESLRPYRSTKKELLDIANELESQYQARICAALLREAAEVYEKRGRLRRE